MKGAQAFPGADAPPSGTYRGMTLRDYFAGQALASFAANDVAGKLLDRDRPRLAKYCYGLADAMLTERKK